MANVRIILKESVGALFSGSLAAAVFCFPLLATFDGKGPDPERIVRLSDLDGREDLAVVGRIDDPRPRLGAPEVSEASAVEAEDADGSDGDARDDAPAEATAAQERPVIEGRARRATRVEGDDGLADGLVAVGQGQGEGTGAKKSGRKSRCTKTMPEIRSLGPDYWAVERELVEYYTASISRLNELGWSGRYDEEGEKGWEVAGFGCTSPLYLAGLRRGDVVQSVNGKNTRNALQVYTTWLKLRKKSEFEVHILRKGEPRILRYRLI